MRDGYIDSSLRAQGEGVVSWGFRPHFRGVLDPTDFKDDLFNRNLFDSCTKRYSTRGVIVCLQRGENDLLMVQLMPLPPHHLLLH